MQAKDLEMATALAQAVDAAIGEIARHVLGFVAEQLRAERVWRMRNGFRV